MTEATGKATGFALLAAATGIASVDLVWLLPWLGDRLPTLLGDRMNDAALVEFLFNGVVFGVLIVSALIGGVVERRRVLTAGDRPVTMAAMGIAIGGFGVSATIGYAALAGILRGGDALMASAPMLIWGAATVAIQAGGEEIFFRGWLQPGLAARWGLAAAVITTASAFAGLHILGGARAPVAVVNLLLGGIIFGLFAAQGRGLAAAAGMHWAWNATEQLVWGVDPNPGIGGFGAISDRELVGSPWWGGSDEGINAGIGMTFILVAILVPLLLKVRAQVRAVTGADESPALRSA